MTFGISTAFRAQQMLELARLIFGESKYFGSGWMRTVVPVLRWPQSPIRLSGSVTKPAPKAMWWMPPPRLISTSRRIDSALVTETPTPCRPPEKR